MRAFIALRLDPEIKKEIIGLIAELKKLDSDVKWVRPEGIHLTLKYLGEISPEMVQSVIDVLMKTAAGKKPFPIRFFGTGTFPHLTTKPRVLWIGAEPSESLKSLYSELESELQNLGFPPEKREFNPHLTLGRVKKFRGLNQVLERLSEYKVRDFGKMIFRRLTLFHSILSPAGAKYSIVEEVPFQ